MATYRFDPDETFESTRSVKRAKRYTGHKLARGIGRGRSKKHMEFEEIPFKQHNRLR